MKIINTGNIHWKIILGFATIYIVWGTTYLMLAFLVKEVPPFLASSMRYSAASLIVFAISAYLGHFASVTRVQLLNALKAGVLFLGFGTGGVTWALQFLDSGLTSLIISTEPLFIVLMMWVINKKRPANNSFIGVFLSMAGMLLLISHQNATMGNNHWYGILALFISILSWGYASIYVSKADTPSSPLLNAGLQMFSGGMAALICSFLVGETHPQWQLLSFRAIFSLVFLIFFGSIVVFSAFNYLLRRVSPDKVATTTYVNPIIALLLGAAFNNEIITYQAGIGGFIILMGVFFINSTKVAT